MIKRRNEIGCDVCSLAFSEEVREPIVREENQSEDALIADLSIRALWEPEFSTCTYAAFLIQINLWRMSVLKR